ncbi:putative transcription factor WRKY family [Helianthus annuus]|nr:putative transcription factor WRKY family [Helianthus annuus]
MEEIWRERNILSSKFPRCYFRCAYKHDQGCEALKQAQKLEDGTNMYRITYIGRHTCSLPNTSRLGEELDKWDQELGPNWVQIFHTIYEARGRLGPLSTHLGDGYGTGTAWGRPPNVVSGKLGTTSRRF